MLKVNRIETFLVDLPTIRPHVLSMATMHRQTIVIVQVQCSDGIVGIGEGTTIGGLSYGDESPESIKLAIDTYFEPILKICDPSRVSQTMARIGRVVVGNHFAKSAVETALLDAMGKRVGLPVSELLGGRHRDELPVACRTCTELTPSQHLQAEDRQARRGRRCCPCGIDQEGARG
jgi:muconate cycloisomerase